MSDGLRAVGKGPFSPAIVEALICGRRSVRAFLGDEVPETAVREILRIASRSPSGANVQPWRVRVLLGDARLRLTAAIADVRADDPVPPPYEYCYPAAQFEPYRARRRKVGYDLYALLGIERGDHAAMTSHLERNYDFFGAPAGLIFTLDRNLGLGAYLELGMFMQSFMLAARGFGLETCAQAALANYHAVIRRQLGIPDNEMIMCGMALGHPDPLHPTSSFRAERAPVDEFTDFHT